MDRVKEGMFSRLESLGALQDSYVLDAFAGSGALGIEALSRAAAHVTFFEKDAKAFRVMRTNLIRLDVLDEVTFQKRDVLKYDFAAEKLARPFTLILLDPPYKIDESEVRALIDRLGKARLLEDGAVAVWEQSAESPAAWPEGFVSLGYRRYGSTVVDIAVYEKEY